MNKRAKAIVKNAEAKGIRVREQEKVAGTTIKDDSRHVRPRVTGLRDARNRVRVKSEAGTEESKQCLRYYRNL